MKEAFFFFRKKEKNGTAEAVSPVIGVILLIVITIIIAAFVYLWVAGLFGGGVKSTPKVEMRVDKENNEYTINVTYISRSVDWDKVQVFLLKEGVSKKSGLVSDFEIYGNITEECELAFIDEDLDSCLSVGDYFRVRGDYDMLRLVHIPTNGMMGEIRLA